MCTAVERACACECIFIESVVCDSILKQVIMQGKKGRKETNEKGEREG